MASRVTFEDMGASGEPFVEKTKEELSAMSKEERTAYHKAKLAAAKAAPAPAIEASKAEKRALAREKQEADRKRKDDLKNAVDGDKETLEELKLQGLTEEQAREVMRQLQSTKVDLEVEVDDDGEVDDSLLDSVKRWMGDHDRDHPEHVDKESLRDFNLKVRFQGHVDTTPPDHLACILEVIACKTFVDLGLGSCKQPAAVAKQVQATFSRWAFMIGALYEKCDALAAADILVSSLRAGVVSAAAPEVQVDCVAVGMLMAVREEVDAIDDEDLLAGLKRLDAESKVMQGFIAHLEESLEGSGEDDSDE